MKLVNVSADREQAVFAAKAAVDFRDNPTHYTYSDNGDPASAALLAIRWNRFAVLVVRISADHEPAVYEAHQFIGMDFPILQPTPSA